MTSQHFKTFFTPELSVSQNQGHCIKEINNVRNCATKKIHSLTSYCFKVYFVEDDALVC